MVSGSAPTATARVVSPTGRPRNRSASARRMAMSTLSRPSVSTWNRSRASRATSRLILPAARTWAKSRTRRSSRLALRGVPRERTATSSLASGSIQDGAGRDAEADPELGGDDVGERRLSEPRAAGEEQVVGRLVPCLGSVEDDREVLLGGGLPDEVDERPGPERPVELHLLDDALLRRRGRGEHAVGHVLAGSRPASCCRAART